MEAVKSNDPSTDGEDVPCKALLQTNSELLKNKGQENGVDVDETSKDTKNSEDIIVDGKPSKGYGFCKV